METVQEKFKLLLKERIAPRLRENGLKGSGQNFYIPSEGYWALMGFQKSMFSDSIDLRFTINLYIVTKDEWEIARSTKSYYPKKPTPTTKWSEGWHKRIGQLMPEKTDHWWRLTSSTDLRSLSKEVITAIEIYGLPEMQERINQA